MEIRRLTTPAQMVAVERLAGEIWRTDGSRVAPHELLCAAAATGGHVAGAFDGERLVGFTAGFLGRDAERDRIELHSHVAGVHPDVQSTGVGFKLKADQRVWAMRNDITAISWTFDPLVRRNAVFNLTKLGVMVGDYLVDFYGDMSDGLNEGGGSDRWWVRWEVRSARVVSAMAGTRHTVVPRSTDLVCPTPDDIEALRATNPAKARKWRKDLRSSLQSALAEGYRVMGLSPAGAYVLRGSSTTRR